MRKPDRKFKNELIKLIPRLRRFALTLTSNMDDADDLVQTALMKALSKSHKWEPGTKLDSWMYRIVYNLMIDQTRSSSRKKIHVPIDELCLSDSQKNGARYAEIKEQIDRVVSAMNRLNDDERALISLVCIEGMSYKDAALTLDIPIGTVMSRLARARKKLHNMVYGNEQRH